MPDVRGRVRGPVIAAGVLLLLAFVLLPPARAAPPRDTETGETGRIGGIDRTGGIDGTGGSAEPAPAVSGAVPTPETAAGELAESIATYDVVLALGTDGVLRVRETITYDFDETGGHGIVRHVPFRRGDRLYEVRDIRTSSSTGAPSRVKTMRLLNDVQISVGGRQREVRGRQAYVIEYEVARAFTPRADHDALVWDAIGTSWDVPIRNAAVRVEAPVPLRHVTCDAGTRGATTRCLRDRDGPYAVDFIQRTLAPREGMKIRVRLPKRAIAVQPPLYVPPRWAGGWPGTALLALSLGMVALLPRRPAPRRRAGPVLAAAGALLVAADAGDEVAAHGLWAFSMGDRCLAGLALMIVGAGVVCVHRFRAV
ncbi:DUF2207 domain-containing protein [Actinomadura sp. 3N407]|uniref:DUF2207 domain-containing protein n=1 Tax=Actinomadura sp. 3N407 TaxID=3457423 RepID=UPI003FCCCAE3